MKIVINKEYGGFAVPNEVADILGCDTYPLGKEGMEIRASAELIEWVKLNPDSPLGVVEFPDEITDFEINEYDGLESITAVLGGKIKHYY